MGTITNPASPGAIAAEFSSLLASADALVFKGVKDCSGNPNYPAADAGHLYKVSVAGKIGGASGINVEVGDSLLCLVDGSAAGTQAAVGANWAVLQSNVEIDTDSTFAANSDGLVPSQKAVKAALDKIALIDWSSGESQPIFAGKDAAGTRLNIKIGSEAKPDETFGPGAKVSRTLSIPETAFSGAGSLGLAAIAGVTKALASSQGQAVGVEGGAVTASSYVGEHSNADAFGGGFTGRSTAGSSRVGGGLFATGQRNHAEGKATGAEISCENNASEDGVYFPNAYSNVMALWLAPKGLHNAAAGIVLGHPETAKFKYGIAANENSLLSAFLLDNSSAERSILIKGAHSEGAIAVASGAGGVAVGAEKVSVTNALLDVYYGEAALTPGVVFGTDKAKNISVRVRNSTGELNLFAANTANNFLTGTAQGDVGQTFSPGKIFHLGAVGKTSQFRVSEAGLGFFGTAPQAKPTGVAKTPEAIWTALNTLGIIA